MIKRSIHENKKSAAETVLKKNKIDADNDLTLVSAIKGSKSKVILGYFFHMSQAELDYHIEGDKIEKQLNRISETKYSLIIYEQQDTMIDPFIKAYAPESNIELLDQATKSAGFVNMIPDSDGVVRNMPLVIKSGKNMYTPLSIQSVWQYLGRPQLMGKVTSYEVEGTQMEKSLYPQTKMARCL